MCPNQSRNWLLFPKKPEWRHQLKHWAREVFLFGCGHRPMARSTERLLPQHCWGFFSTRFSHVLLGNWPSWQKCVCVLPWFWSVCLCVPESHIWKHQAMFVLLCLFFALPKPFSSLLFSPALGHLVLVLNKVPAPRPAPPFPNPIVLIMWKK